MTESTSTPNAYNFYLSTDNTTKKASLCISDKDGKCLSETITHSNEWEKGDRKFYKMARPFMIPVTASVSSPFIMQIFVDDKPVRRIMFVKEADDDNEWKVVLMASDQSNQNKWIRAFDRARIKLKEIFLGSGVREENIQELSLHPNHQTEKVRPTTVQNFKTSVEAMQPGKNGACLVHMTSHGSKGAGFNMGRFKLDPTVLDDALERGCGDKPTVVLISACFSGIYTQEQAGLRKPNRIILTAARHDRTSFGCSADAVYTFWDGCLIENLPKSKTWSDLSTNIRQCITTKESRSNFTPSEPQAFFGEDVKDLLIPASLSSGKI